jgi:hypothetical protein
MLSLISVLMIVYQFGTMALAQYVWTMNKLSFEGIGTYSSDSLNEVIVALISVNQVTFGLALWLFVYNYYSLSWRIHLIVEKKSSDLYNTRLKVLNFVMCTYTVGVPLMGWVFDKYKAIFIGFTTVGSFSLIISSAFLYNGLLRLNSATKSQQSYIVNKTAILWLFISSLLLILSTLGMCYF